MKEQWGALRLQQLNKAGPACLVITKRGKHIFVWKAFCYRYKWQQQRAPRMKEAGSDSSLSAPDPTHHTQTHTHTHLHTHTHISQPKHTDMCPGIQKRQTTLISIGTNTVSHLHTNTGSSQQQYGTRVPILLLLSFPFLFSTLFFYLIFSMLLFSPRPPPSPHPPLILSSRQPSYSVA